MDGLIRSDYSSEYIDRLEIIHEGNSKIVRKLSDNLVLITLKPTIYSYTYNRSGVVPGTEIERLKASKKLWDVLTNSGISTTIKIVSERYFISDFVKNVPIEVIVKLAHVGTPKHIYKGMETKLSRFGTYITPNHKHEPYVRFDWRNDLPHKDECLPLWLADQFIDTKKATNTALASVSALTDFFRIKQLELLDICFFITEDGEKIYGEVSPDCMRVKFEDKDFDKDLWRKGAKESIVLNQWRQFNEIIDV